MHVCMYVLERVPQRARNVSPPFYKRMWLLIYAEYCVLEERGEKYVSLCRPDNLSWPRKLAFPKEAWHIGFRTRIFVWECVLISVFVKVWDSQQDGEEGLFFEVHQSSTMDFEKILDALDRVRQKGCKTTAFILLRNIVPHAFSDFKYFYKEYSQKLNNLDLTFSEFIQAYVRLSLFFSSSSLDSSLMFAFRIWDRKVYCVTGYLRISLFESLITVSKLHTCLAQTWMIDSKCILMKICKYQGTSVHI